MDTLTFISLVVLLPCMALIGWFAMEAIFTIAEAVWTYKALRQVYEWDSVDAMESDVVVSAWLARRMLFFRSFCAMPLKNADSLKSRLESKISGL